MRLLDFRRQEQRREREAVRLERRKPSAVEVASDVCRRRGDDALV